MKVKNLSTQTHLKKVKARKYKVKNELKKVKVKNRKSDTDPDPQRGPPPPPLAPCLPSDLLSCLQLELELPLGQSCSRTWGKIYEN